MNRVIQVLESFDAFSVAFTPSLNLHSKNTNHRSIIGGVISIIIITFSMFYALDLLQKWFTRQMVMKAQSSSEYLDTDFYKEIFQEQQYQNIFNFYVLSNDDVMVDPFKEDEIILLPLSVDPFTGEVENLLKYHDPVDQVLYVGVNDSLIDTYKVFLFIQCQGNEQFLINDQKCATIEQINSFFALAGLELDLQIFTDVIDLTTKKVNQSLSHTFSLLEKDFSTFKVVTTQYSLYEINDGILFQNSQKNILLTDYSVRDQIGTRDYMTGYFQYYQPEVQQVYSAFQVRANFVINHVIAQYPTISEVLANIGSIIQTLMLVRFIIEKVNRYNMLKNFKDFCKELYFPDLKLVKQVGKGKNVEYFIHGKQIESQNYKRFQEILDKILDEKLNYANLIYEISRMQAVLEELTTHYIIFQSHQKKGELILEQDLQSQKYKIKNKWRFENYKSEADVTNQLYPFAFNYSQNQLCQELSSSLDFEMPMSTTRRFTEKQTLVFLENREQNLVSINFVKK